MRRRFQDSFAAKSAGEPADIAAENISAEDNESMVSRGLLSGTSDSDTESSETPAKELVESIGYRIGKADTSGSTEEDGDSDEASDDIDELIESIEATKISPQERTLLANIKSLTKQLRETENLSPEELKIITEADDLVDQIMSGSDKEKMKGKILARASEPINRMIEQIIENDKAISTISKSFGVELLDARKFAVEDDEMNIVRLAVKIEKNSAVRGLAKGIEVAIRHKHRNAAQIRRILKGVQLPEIFGADVTMSNQTVELLKDSLNPIRSPFDGVHVLSRDIAKVILQ